MSAWHYNHQHDAWMHQHVAVTAEVLARSPREYVERWVAEKVGVPLPEAAWPKPPEPVKTVAEMERLVLALLSTPRETIEGAPGWYVPEGQDWCPRCGDTNYDDRT